MSFTIYGIRLIGSMEVRYVGLTSKPLAVRFKQHHQGVCVPHLNGWLQENAGRVEAFALASVEDKREAQATEKVVTLLCARLGHRLFNRANVPVPLRWHPAAQLRAVA